MRAPLTLTLTLTLTLALTLTLLPPASKGELRATYYNLNETFTYNGTSVFTIDYPDAVNSTTLFEAWATSGPVLCDGVVPPDASYFGPTGSCAFSNCGGVSRTYGFEATLTFTEPDKGGADYQFEFWVDAGHGVVVRMDGDVVLSRPLSNFWYQSARVPDVVQTHLSQGSHNFSIRGVEDCCAGCGLLVFSRNNGPLVPYSETAFSAVVLPQRINVSVSVVPPPAVPPSSPIPIRLILDPDVDSGAALQSVDVECSFLDLPVSVAFDNPHLLDPSNDTRTTTVLVSPSLLGSGGWAFNCSVLRDSGVLRPESDLTALQSSIDAFALNPTNGTQDASSVFGAAANTTVIAAPGVLASLAPLGGDPHAYLLSIRLATSPALDPTNPLGSEARVVVSCVDSPTIAQNTSELASTAFVFEPFTAHIPQVALLRLDLMANGGNALSSLINCSVSATSGNYTQYPVGMSAPLLPISIPSTPSPPPPSPPPSPPFPPPPPPPPAGSPLGLQGASQLEDVLDEESPSSPGLVGAYLLVFGLFVLVVVRLVRSRARDNELYDVDAGQVIEVSVLGALWWRHPVLSLSRGVASLLTHAAVAGGVQVLQADSFQDTTFDVDTLLARGEEAVLVSVLASLCVFVALTLVWGTKPKVSWIWTGCMVVVGALAWSAPWILPDRSPNVASTATVMGLGCILSWCLVDVVWIVAAYFINNLTYVQTSTTAKVVPETTRPVQARSFRSSIRAPSTLDGSHGSAHGSDDGSDDDVDGWGDGDEGTRSVMRSRHSKYFEGKTLGAWDTSSSTDL